MDGDEPPYRFERLTLDQLPALLQLHHAVYGPGWEEGDARRKFASPVEGHDVVGYLAYAPDGAPAAYYGVFPTLLDHRGEQVVAGQSGDTMTHPDHRGRGLFTELARRAYRDAADEGVQFVFGFPNTSSYPGFVKYLDWSHHRTMRSYWLAVPTVPLRRLTRRRPALARRVDAAVHRVVRGLGLATPATALTSSVLADGRSGVVRDEAFVAYKGPGLLTFEQSGVRVYLRIDDHLSVGDVVATPDARPWGALARLVLIAMVSGRYRIRFHVSPDAAADRLLTGRMPVKEGLPYGHVAFVEGLDPEMFDFTFIDYDTF